MSSSHIREPAVAGAFYPADPDELRTEVQRLLARAECNLEPDRQLKAVACPHAGYLYSGGVAAEAFACFRNRQIDTVVLVGPDHYIGFEGIAVYPEGAFRTPLGDVPIDAELAAYLIDQGEGVRAAPEAHAREHALEVQLPFLQAVLPRAQIVPILMGFRSRSNVELMATLLSQALDNPRVCLLASTDLSHYHPRHKAKELDGRVRELVRAFAPTALWDELRKGRCEACGGDALVAVMLGAGIAGAESSRVLRYADSGDAGGDPQHVVGYLSAAFFRGRPETSVEFAAEEMAYTPQEMDSLLHLAYESAVRGGDPAPVLELRAVTDRLREPRGAFVTLRNGGELRGCIGFTEADRPLWRTVAQAAAAAAREDPRFPPVLPEEMPEVTIEISILTPPRRVAAASDVVPGRHGVRATGRGRRGLLLPQVAREQGWSREELLTQTCVKAGLPGAAWKDGDVILEIFEAAILAAAPRRPKVNGGR